jgi:sulfur-carrier protein adenylyltransferase/sulfurtransferase
MKAISVSELKEMIDEKKDFQLIDVREKNEFEICEIGGKLIPMGTIPQHVEEISKDKMVVVHCRSGKRSANVIEYLEKNHGFTNLYNLEGGILAWIDEVDDSLPRY